MKINVGYKRFQPVGSGLAAEQDPVVLSGGAVVSWHDLGRASSDVNGFSSIPDNLDAASPLTQSTNAQKPQVSVGTNGIVAMTTDGNDTMTRPMTSVLNSSTKWGFACWVKLTAGGYFLFNDTQIKVNPFLDTSAANGLICDVYSGIQARRGKTAAVPPAVPFFLTMEVDLTQSTEATKLLITINNVVQTLTFDNSQGLSAMPATMNTGGSNWRFFAANGSGAAGCTVKLGRDFWMVKRQMTSAERDRLMALRPLT